MPVQQKLDWKQFFHIQFCVWVRICLSQTLSSASYLQSCYSWGTEDPRTWLVFLAPSWVQSTPVPEQEEDCLPQVMRRLGDRCSVASSVVVLGWSEKDPDGVGEKARVSPPPHGLGRSPPVLNRIKFRFIKIFISSAKVYSLLMPGCSSTLGQGTVT